jgi:hypothetical protein
MGKRKLEYSADDVGNKAANLYILDGIIKGHVPSFYALSDSTIKNYLTHFAPRWLELWANFQKFQGDEKAEISDAAKQSLDELRILIIYTFEHNPIVDKETQTYLMQQKDKQLMVRSTGEEDTIEVANPGGNETVSAVSPNDTDVSTAIGRVIASYFSEKSLKQRLLSQKNDITQGVFMPVLLQQMIGESRNGATNTTQIVHSGVMYTGKKVTRIQVAPGHGELVVDSKASFDTVTVTMAENVYSHITEKTFRLAPSDNGLVWKRNPNELEGSASISQSVAIRLKKLGDAIEDHYGMPMDVEFVYAPEQDIIHIVQARPIPANRTKLLVPSSVPPEGIHKLKAQIKANRIEKYDAEVITPAGFAARIITSAEEVLVCNNLEEGLSTYLRLIDPKIKVVFVQEISASSSHPAAEFSTMAITVMQVDDLNTIGAWLESGPILMVDPQRNQVLNCINIVSKERAERELRELGYLKEGMFAYPTSPITPQPVVVKGLDVSSIVNRITKVPINKQNIFSQLLEAIDVLKEINPDQYNDAPLLKALNDIRYIFYQIALSERGEVNFFGQVILICEEIAESISILKDNYSDEALKEHLSLVALLQSFVTEKGNSSSYSNSIRQIYQEKKAAKMLMGGLPSDTPEFNLDQRAYLVQFLKLNKLALTQQNKQDWSYLVIYGVQNEASLAKLAKIVKFYVKNNLSSELINIDLQQAKSATDSCEGTLNQLNSGCDMAMSEFLHLKLEEKNHIINSWTKRLHEWGNPDKFEQLWCDYQRDMFALMKSLSFNNYWDNIFTEEQFLAELNNNNEYEYTGIQLNVVTQRAILILVGSLIDLMDKTIKSLKSSHEYSTSAPDLLIKRFPQLLKLYYILMADWMMVAPRKVYHDWYKKVNKYLDCPVRNWRYLILDKIGDVVLNSSPFSGLLDLSPSGKMSVSSVKIGSGANFNRQFIEIIQHVTYEDIFSLIHQNTLTAVTTISNTSFPFPKNSLPTVLMPLISSFENLKSIEFYCGEEYTTNVRALDLIHMTHSYPVLSLTYNCPMGNHCAQYTIEYNQITQKITLHGEMFGYNQNNRMRYITAVILLDGEESGVVVKKMPVYDQEKLILGFTWEISNDNLEFVSSIVSNNILSYDKILRQHPKFCFQLDRTDFQFEDEILRDRYKQDDSNSKKLREKLVEHLKEVSFFDLPRAPRCRNVAPMAMASNKARIRQAVNVHSSNTVSSSQNSLGNNTLTLAHFVKIRQLHIEYRKLIDSIPFSNLAYLNALIAKIQQIKAKLDHAFLNFSTLKALYPTFEHDNNQANQLLAAKIFSLAKVLIEENPINTQQYKDLWLNQDFDCITRIDTYRNNIAILQESLIIVPNEVLTSTLKDIETTLNASINENIQIFFDSFKEDIAKTNQLYQNLKKRASNLDEASKEEFEQQLGELTLLIEICQKKADFFNHLKNENRCALKPPSILNKDVIKELREEVLSAEKSKHRVEKRNQIASESTEHLNRSITNFIQDKGQNRLINDLKLKIDAYKKDGRIKSILDFVNSKVEHTRNMQLRSTINRIKVELLDFEDGLKREQSLQKAGIEANSAKFSTLLMAVRAKADILAKEYNGYSVRLMKLSTEIKEMNEYAEKCNKETTGIVSTLALQLLTDVDEFMGKKNECPSESAYKAFQEKFLARLHSQDYVMNQKDKSWKERVPTIVLCVLFLGVPIVGSYAATKLIYGRAFLFWERTNKEKYIYEVEEVVKEVSTSLKKI